MLGGEGTRQRLGARMDDDLPAVLKRWLRSASAPATAVALLYLFVGALWVSLSDRFLAAAVEDPVRLTLFQTYKGWAFVVGTALLLYILVWAAFRFRERHARAEAELNRFLTTLLKNLPGMAYRCANQKSWPMEYVSYGVAPLTGYSQTDVENGRVTWAELIVPEDREGVWEEVQSAVERQGPFRLVYRIRTRSGQLKWVWEQGRGVYSEGGELLALEGFITDITARKLAEERLALGMEGPRSGRSVPAETGSRPYPPLRAWEVASDR